MSESESQPSATEAGTATVRDDARELVKRAERALETCEQRDALLALASSTWIERAAAGRIPTAEELRAKATDLGLDAARTALGDAVGSLVRDPDDAAERALGAVIVATALARAFRADGANDERLAAAAMWLTARTPFDVLVLVDTALGDDSDRAWRAIAARIERADSDTRGGPSRGEAAVACAALAVSRSSAAVSARDRLRVDDALLASILASGSSDPADAIPLTGTATSPPRGVVLTVLQALSGWLVLAGVVRLIARLALAYRNDAELRVAASGVRLHVRTSMLGRTLRERDALITRDALSHVVRDVRYPRAALYAGLFALALGSYVGVAMVTDGVRSASPSLLGIGALVLGAGIALDFVLTTLLPARHGRVRVSFHLRKGRGFTVAGLDRDRIDAALERLARAR